MEKVSYFDMAENDYCFLDDDFKRGRVGNVMCYASQCICERYLKYLIEKFYKGEEDTTVILHTHSIKMLRKFVCKKLPDFMCDWPKILPVDGYYFSDRYPGDDSFIVDAEDVQISWEAATELRESLLKYVANKQEEKSNDIVAELQSFDNYDTK